MRIDESIQLAVNKALRASFDDNEIMDFRDSWTGDGGVFEFGIDVSSAACNFIDEILRNLTVEQKGNFIKEYMLDLSSKEAGEAFGEFLTAKNINPMRDLAIECAKEMLDTDYCQTYLAGLAKQYGSKK